MTRTHTHPFLLRWAVSLVVLSLLAALLPAQHAVADHTPMPAAVALVGPLQSELGCPGDWQPECAATRLAPVPGSPEVFRATFKVPAGSSSTRSRSTKPGTRTTARAALRVAPTSARSPGARSHSPTTTPPT